MRPSEKSPEMDEDINNFYKRIAGRGRTESIEQNICAFCGKPAMEFKDKLSIKEYTISGLCQQCQDDTFEEEDEDDNY